MTEDEKARARERVAVRDQARREANERIKNISDRDRKISERQFAAADN